MSSNSSPYHSHKKLTWQFKALSYWQTTVPIHSFIHSAWAGTIGVLAFRRKQDLMPRVIWIQPLHERHHIVYQIINLPIKKSQFEIKRSITYLSRLTWDCLLFFLNGSANRSAVFWKVNPGAVSKAVLINRLNGFYYARPVYILQP